MNKLKREKQIAVLSALVEGNSIRSTERMTGVHRDTIMRLLARVGDGCDGLTDSLMRGLDSRRVQVDEIWGYIRKKQRHLTPEDDPERTGDIWTFVALDADTKLVPSYRVGKRTAANTRAFLDDLSSRLTNRVQLSSDALELYVEAAERAFGADVDYGQIVKSYEAEPSGPGRYSPPHVTATKRTPVAGDPDVAHISTSYVERNNLSMRMGIRRLTRLTNAFSKKLENFRASVALWFAYYNLVRVHRTLRVTPAMEAGVTNSVWTLGELLEAADSQGEQRCPP